MSQQPAREVVPAEWRPMMMDLVFLDEAGYLAGVRAIVDELTSLWHQGRIPGRAADAGPGTFDADAARALAAASAEGLTADAHLARAAAFLAAEISRLAHTETHG